MADNNAAIVIGGGISGLLSALLLKRNFDRVYLTEREPECGGLFRSFLNKEGVSFDYGTHVLVETGIVELDELLFEGIGESEDWHALKILKAGSYFRGRLNEQTQFIDTTLLPPEMYQRGIVEMLNLGAIPPVADNLEKRLVNFYGETFVEQIFRPLIVKFFGCAPGELSPETDRFMSAFGLNRIVALTPEAVRELKKIPLFDEKFAFHSFYEGVSALYKYYPKHGGIGTFVDLLTRKLKKAGVNVLTRETIQQIDHHNGAVKRVHLASGKEIDCALLVWTAPLYFFVGAAGVKLPFPVKAPQFRATGLYHFVFDRPFQTELAYLNCHDVNLKTFRVTFYPNIGEKPRGTPPHNCTVEVLSDAVEDTEEMLEKTAKELVAMGVVSGSARVLYKKGESIERGFPVVTSDFVNRSKQQLEFVKELFGNVAFLGKANASFFSSDVLKDTYAAIEGLDNHGQY